MLIFAADTARKAYLHNIDPFAWQIAGDFGIRWYGLAYAAGFIVAFLAARRLAVLGLIKLSPGQVGDYIIACILGVLIGGRLGWVIFYGPSALWTFTDTLPFWEVLAINHGGMASHGGVIGLGVAMLWFGRRHEISPFHLFDISALVVPFGLFFGRLANFVNGELRGQACDADFPLAVKFPQEIVEDWSAGEVGAAIGAADAVGMTHFEWLRIVNRAEIGDTEALASLQFLRQRLVEYVQMGNEEVLAVVEPMLIARHPSQLYQATAEGLVLGMALWGLWWFVWRKKRFADRVGLTSISFLIIYGVLRVITEIWRLPDEGIARVLGLSRGQWLSVAMVVCGLVLGSFLLWRKVELVAEADEPAND